MMIDQKTSYDEFHSDVSGTGSWSQKRHC